MRYMAGHPFMSAMQIALQVAARLTRLPVLLSNHLLAGLLD